MTPSPKAIEADMEKIRAMIEKSYQNYKKSGYDYLTASIYLDCYEAFGGDVSKWRDEKGVLR